jgi:hypothetical protein
MCRIEKNGTPSYCIVSSGGSPTICTDGNNSTIFMNNTGNQDSTGKYGCQNSQNQMMQNLMNTIMQAIMLMQQLTNNQYGTTGSGCGSCGCDNSDTDTTSPSFSINCPNSSSSDGTCYDMNDYWGSAFGTGCSGSGYKYVDKNSEDLLDMNTGLNYSKNYLKQKLDGSQGEVKDNKVSLEEYGKFSDIANRNGDKYVSPGEDFALQSVIDKDHDGRISNCELSQAFNRLKYDKVNFGNEVNTMYYSTPCSKSGTTISSKENAEQDLDKVLK